MSKSSLAYPSVLLFRARGTIMYANSHAIEQTGWLTGSTPNSLGNLENLLDRLYPAKPARERAGYTLRRALRLAKHRGQVRFRIEVPPAGGRPCFWEVQITPGDNPLEETYQLHFGPSGGSMGEEGGGSKARVLRTAAHHARRILERAMAMEEAGGSPEEEGELSILVAVMGRAAGLLSTLERPSGDPMPTPSPRAQA